MNKKINFYSKMFDTVKHTSSRICLSLSCLCIDLKSGISYTTFDFVLMYEFDPLHTRLMVFPNFRSTGSYMIYSDDGNDRAEI